MCNQQCFLHLKTIQNGIYCLQPKRSGINHYLCKNSTLVLLFNIKYLKQMIFKAWWQLNRFRFFDGCGTPGFVFQPFRFLDCFSISLHCILNTDLFTSYNLQVKTTIHLFYKITLNTFETRFILREVFFVMQMSQNLYSILILSIKMYAIVTQYTNKLKLLAPSCALYLYPQRLAEF